MPDKVVDLLYDKYFKGLIHYEGLQRVENYPVHPDAIREAVLNAIVHKDYASGNPIQIRVYDDKVVIFNNGNLSADWSVEKLLAFHTSDPRNPTIASVFFRSGLTEAWGRGIEKIVNSNVGSGKPKPEFEMNSSGLRVIFYSDTEDGKNVGINVGIKINETQQKIIDAMRDNPRITAEEMAKTIGISQRRVESNTKILKANGLVRREGPRKGGYWVVSQSE